MAQKDEFADDNKSLKLRSYQAEVLQKCLEKNVIIASPTGSEKRLLGREYGAMSLTISVQAARLTLLSLASKLN
jgi:ERCC4-related helicase